MEKLSIFAVNRKKNIACQRKRIKKKPLLYGAHCVIYVLFVGESYSCFSFLRFINVAPSEACSIMTKDIAFRFMFLLLLLEDAYRLYHRRLWDDNVQNTRYGIVFPQLIVQLHQNIFEDAIYA
jgi:hypothetical protein